jgi:hypothetical protein
VPVAASQAIEAFNVVQRLAMRVARIDSFILLPDASASPE